MRPRLALTAAALLLGLLLPGTAAAVTVPQALSVPPTKIGDTSAVIVAFAAEGVELMGTAVVEGDPAFTIGEDTCSGQEVSGECTITMRFAPSAVGERSATLRLAGARGEAVVKLTGAGYAVGARLSVSPAVVAFPPFGAGLLSPPRSVTVTAGGDLPVRITGLAFEGPAPGDFVVTQDGCSRTSLVPGAACRLEVRSNPSGSGGGVARLRLLTDPPDASTTIGVIAPAPGAIPPPAPGAGGAGLAPPPIVDFNPPPWSLGIVGLGHSTRRTTVRVYTSLPARVTVAVLRRGRTVRRRSRRISAGVVKVVVRGRLARGRYRVRVVGVRGSVRRTDRAGLRVR